MKISDLEIDGFGVWSALSIRNLSPQLNVFYGPNEAGKTTLMQFTRAMCYGFSPARRKRYLPPVHGSSAGGSMSVDTDEGRFQITRHESPADPLGVVDVIGAGGGPAYPSGAAQGQDFIRGLLGNVDEATFNNVFAVGLREIQELGTLADGEAARLLYELSSGSDRVSLGHVLRELDASRNRLLSDDPDQPSQIPELYAQRAKLRGEIDELTASGRRFARLGGQREQHHREIARLEAEIADLEGRLHDHDAALTVADRWQRRQDLDRQILGVGPLDAVAPKMLARLESLIERMKRHQRGRQRARRRGIELREEILTLPIKESFAQHATRLQSLGEFEPQLAASEAKVSQVHGEIADLQRRLAAEKQELGLPADAPLEQLHQFATRGLASLQAAARAMTKARRGRLKRVQLPQSLAVQQPVQQLVTQPAPLPVPTQSVVPSTEPNNDRRKSDLRHDSDTRQDKGARAELAAAIQSKGQLVAQLRRRIQVDERLEQLNRHQRELEMASRDHLEEQILPPWAYCSLGGIFIAGVVMTLSGLFLPTAVTGAMSWFLVLFGLALGGASLVIKMYYEHEAKVKFDYAQKQLNVLKGQLRQTTDERDALDRDLPRGGGPLDLRLKTAETELAKLEERLADHPEPLPAAPRSVEVQPPVMPQMAVPTLPIVQQVIHTTRRRRSKADMQRARDQWRTALHEAGLPDDLSPKRVRQLVHHRDDALDLVRQIDRRRELHEQHRRDQSAVHGRISQLLTDVDLRPAGKTPGEHLRQLQAAFSEHTAMLRRRKGLKKQHRKQRRLYLKHSARIKKYGHSRRRLLVSAGVASEEELRRQATRKQQIERLTQQRDALEHEFNSLLLPNHHDAVVSLLNAHPGNTLLQHRTRVDGELDGARRQLAAMLELRGELTQQIKGISGDRRLADRHLELSAVEHRLRHAVHRWQVLATTSGLLDRIRGDYERRHQPDTLKEASNYLARLTQGNYQRVWAPMDEHLLRVDDAQGNALPVEVLSRGTREQLFLSLRLALVTAFQRRGVSLPLVLDDVLVNFDVGRAKAAAEVLAEYAAGGRQLLVFTCHEHVADMFAALDAQVRRLPENSRAGQILAVEDRTSARRPARSKKKAQAAVEEPPVQPEPIAPPVLELPPPHVAEVHPPVRLPLRNRRESALPQIQPEWPSEATPVHLPKRRRNEHRLTVVRPVWPDGFTPVTVARRNSYERVLPRIRPVWQENFPPVRVPRRLRAERALPLVRPVSGDRFIPVRSPQRPLIEPVMPQMLPVWRLGYTPPVQVPKAPVASAQRIVHRSVSAYPPVHVPLSRVVYMPVADQSPAAPVRPVVLPPRLIADRATPVRAPKFLTARQPSPVIVEAQRQNLLAEEAADDVEVRHDQAHSIQPLEDARLPYTHRVVFGVGDEVADSGENGHDYANSNGQTNGYGPHPLSSEQVLKLADEDFSG